MNPFTYARAAMVRGVILCGWRSRPSSSDGSETPTEEGVIERSDTRLRSLAAAEPIAPLRQIVHRHVTRPNLAAAFWCAIAVVWFLVFRPVAWGGPAGYNIVSGVSMQPTLEPGDLIFTSVQPTYRIGDVVAYRVPAGSPSAGSIVVHRIIGGNCNNGFITKGDNASLPDPWHPTRLDVVGRVWASVPDLGRIFLSFRTPVALAAAMGLIAGVWWYTSSNPSPKPKVSRPRLARWRGTRSHATAAGE